MSLFIKLYNKYVVESGCSSGLSHRIHNQFIDSAFHDNYISVGLAIFSALVIYGVLLLFPNDIYLSIWLGAILLFYMGRLGMVRLYKVGHFLFLKTKEKRVSDEIIVLMGLFVGVSWLFLFAVVFLNPIYGFNAQLTASCFLMLYAYAGLSLYCMIPLWCLSFVLVTFIPICIILCFFGLYGLIGAAVLICYASFLLAMSYRNYQLHFKALYLQYQNEDYVYNIDKYSRNLESLNEVLKKKNKELIDEIRRRKGAEKKLKILASRDSLTGVTNRVSLEAKMSSVFRYANRTNTIVGIIFIDFDRFKLINDTFGHNVGDELLKSVAQRLRNCIRETDEVFRIGGDEFILLLTNLDVTESLIPIAQTILSALGKPHLIGDISLTLKASMGISIYPGDGNRSEDLLKCADMAMYHSKGNGGDSFTFYVHGMQ